MIKRVSFPRGGAVERALITAIYCFFLESCGLTKFCSGVPLNFKTVQNLPINTCLCAYHSNFIEAVAALHKAVPSTPKHEHGFIDTFLCENSTASCWFGDCGNCDGITVEKLKQLVTDDLLQTPVSWMAWKKDTTSKRTEKVKEHGSLLDLVKYIAQISPQFLKHCFIKRAQCEMFTTYDRPRALSAEFYGEALLQVDFAENYVCEAQDEVQNAHWNQRQLSLFTSALLYNGKTFSKVFVSNNLHHTKETIIPYVHKLLSSLPETVKIVKIWSDGPSSQFKNKFIAAIIGLLESTFNTSFFWNYFATSHGKGCVDGIGATVKNVVRKHIKARQASVNSAADFVNAFNLTPSTISVEQVTDEDFCEINNKLNVAEIFLNTKNIPDIASAHQIQQESGNIRIFSTSKEGYNQS